MVYAMFCLTAFTICIGLIAVRARFISIRKGQISVDYLELMQGQAIPEKVIKTTRCFNNLFEVPVLFYIACTLYITLGIESNLAIAIAWIFVALRIVQAYIHLTYNYVRHRMLAFGVSVLCVLMLWSNLLLSTM